MRIHRRHGARIVLIGAAALLVAGAATALANNVSTLSGTKITPSKLPKTTFKPVSLFVHTGTTYTHPGDKAHGGFAKTVTLLFDNDGKITPGSVPQCAGAFTSGTTLKQAWNTCGPGAGAAKNAYLSPPSAVSGRASTAPPSNFNGCVLAFRGKNTAQGNPTVVLFTRVTLAVNGTANCANPANNTSGNTSLTLKGTITNAGVAGFGKKLTVPNIDTAPLPLDDFTTTVQRGNYLSARCSHPSHTLRIKGTFAYSGTGEAPDTTTVTQNCTVG
jgi:hypothetical protein